MSAWLLIWGNRSQVGGSEQTGQSRAREGAGPQANARGSDRGWGFSGFFRDNPRICVAE